MRISSHILCKMQCIYNVKTVIWYWMKPTSTAYLIDHILIWIGLLKYRLVHILNNNLQSWELLCVCGIWYMYVCMGCMHCMWGEEYCGQIYWWIRGKSNYKECNCGHMHVHEHVYTCIHTCTMYMYIHVYCCQYGTINHWFKRRQTKI